MPKTEGLPANQRKSFETGDCDRKEHSLSGLVSMFKDLAPQGHWLVSPLTTVHAISLVHASKASGSV